MGMSYCVKTLNYDFWRFLGLISIFQMSWISTQSFSQNRSVQPFSSDIELQFYFHSECYQSVDCWHCHWGGNLVRLSFRPFFIDFNSKKSIFLWSVIDDFNTLLFMKKAISNWFLCIWKPCMSIPRFLRYFCSLNLL